MSLVLYHAGTATTLTVYVRQTQQIRASNYKEIPIPGKNPVLIPLGRKGPSIRLLCDLTSTEYSNLNTIDVDEIVSVTSSTYDEFTAAENWHIDKVQDGRKGGFGDRWSIQLTMTKKW
ncbi:hypothetical protein KAT92_06110 [Candidatus Babeliales bacterium]|nr:hypothetical protein [Candidatus Babeliales bacterium]